MAHLEKQNPFQISAESNSTAVIIPITILKPKPAAWNKKQQEQMLRQEIDRNNWTFKNKF
jgi:hypothetical protein